MNTDNQAFDTAEGIAQNTTQASSCCRKSSCCAPPISTIVNSQAKVGRNDPCPCQSGRKFKKCCG